MGLDFNTKHQTITGDAQSSTSQFKITCILHTAYLAEDLNSKLLATSGDSIWRRSSTSPASWAHHQLGAIEDSWATPCLLLVLKQL